MIPEQALLVNGTVGTGKTTTADAVGALLRGRGVPHAIVDLDRLTDAWLAPDREHWDWALTLRNAASLSQAFRETGHRCLVLAGVLETVSDRAELQEALGVPLAVCRLVVDPAELVRRLSARHEDAEERAWHVARAPELAAILDEAAVDDHVVTVGGHPPRVVAERVLEITGWPVA